MSIDPISVCVISSRQKFVPKGGAAENQEEEEEHQKEGNSY